MAYYDVFGVHSFVRCALSCCTFRVCILSVGLGKENVITLMKLLRVLIKLIQMMFQSGIKLSYPCAVLHRPL
jgi:hypothetical protein